MIHLEGHGQDGRWPGRLAAASGEEAGKEDSVEDAEVVLKRAPLFEGLDEESARTLRRQMPDVKLSRGEHLFLEGQEGDRLYIVLDGKLKLTRAAADGRENLLSVLGPGEMFGELSLFDPRPRTASDRKSTRLNSSHPSISYAVFCLKKKKKNT